MDIDQERAVDLTLDRIWEGAYGTPPILPANDMARAILALRQGAQHANRAAFYDFLRPTVIEQVSRAREWAQGMCDALGQECSKFKVLCLSDSATAAPLWGNYTETLTGVALQFAPRLAPDSFLGQAQPVIYLDELPPLHTTESLADLMAGRLATDADRLCDLFLYTKTVDWAPEREWRIVAGHGWHPEDEIEFVDFPVEALEAVIIGSRASSEFRDTIREIVARDYPHARFQQLRRPKFGMGYEIADI